nr:reverse transcriptase domain-containing protein [Tanacetum cinerariifolium]
MTRKQKREYYMAVIKRNLGWRFKDFKGMKFEEIEVKFAEGWKQVEEFIPMGSEEETEWLKRKGLNLEKEQCMRTKRSYFTPTSTIPRRSRKQTTNVVEPEFRTIVEMADNRTMAQMLQAPIEGYEDAIVVPKINANNFDLKQTLINLVQSNQFTGRQDPQNHLRWFNKITSTFRHLEFKVLGAYDPNSNSFDYPPDSYHPPHPTRHTRVIHVEMILTLVMICQPENHKYYDEQNFCYDYNSFGFDQIQTPQYIVNHPIFNAHNDFLNSQNELFTSQNKIMEQMTQLTSICEMTCQIVQKKLEEKQIEEEQAAKARYWKIPACCDEDDDYDSAITPILSTKEPIDSLSMGDEHLDTIPVTESDELIKSCVENLVPNPK